MRKSSATNWSGATFGRWTALRLSNSRLAGRTLWECRCECGEIRDVLTCHLVRGKSLSCGCLKAERTIARLTVHGQAGRSHGIGQTSEYRTWHLMRARCSNANLPEYPNYGGRGITVCQRWEDGFVNFFEDMGPKPSAKHSLDRIDNSKGYSPENCRWATRKQQANNTRRNVNVVVEGEPMTFTQAFEKYQTGRSYKASLDRLRKGQSIEEALGLP